MNQIESFLTEATCGEACWMAREDVCRCSCGGKNHGCLKTAEGSQPIRTAKIQGTRYELAAVGDAGELHKAAYALNLAEGITFVYADSSTDPMEAGVPAKLRRASKEQMQRWPELSAHLAQRTAAAKTAQCYADLDKSAPWPYLLWKRV